MVDTLAISCSLQDVSHSGDQGEVEEGAPPLPPHFPTVSVAPSSLPADDELDDLLPSVLATGGVPLDRALLHLGRSLLATGARPGVRQHFGDA